MSTVERRNDIGTKAVGAVLQLVLVLILSFSIYAAQRAEQKANVNAIEIRGVQKDIQNTKEILCEMREDIKTILSRTR